MKILMDEKKKEKAESLKEFVVYKRLRHNKKYKYIINDTQLKELFEETHETVRHILHT